MIVTRMRRPPTTARPEPEAAQPKGLSSTSAETLVACAPLVVIIVSSLFVSMSVSMVSVIPVIVALTSSVTAVILVIRRGHTEAR